MNIAIYANDISSLDFPVKIFNARFSKFASTGVLATAIIIHKIMFEVI